MAKFCRHCGSPLSVGAKFCKNCGQPLEAASGQPESAPAEPVRQRTEQPPVQLQPRPMNRPAADNQPKASFCRFCGNPILPGAKFCNNCGKALENTETLQPEPSTPQNPAQKPKRSAKKAETTPELVTPLSGSPEVTMAEPVRQPAAKGRSRKTAQKSTSAGAKQSVVFPGGQTLAAAATAGEIDFGVMDLPGFSGITEPITEALSPIAGIFQGIGSWVSGIFRIFKNPVSLIGTLALAALYVFLALNRGSDSPIIKWLSLLTYAEGGFDRGGLDSVQEILGTIGGTIGKGTTAAALLSLFNGGLLNVFMGIGALFTGHGEKRSFISLLFGILLGGAAYFVFTGRQPSEGSFVAGIAGAVLSLEALGAGSGKLYTLAQSLTSRASDGIRTAIRGKCDSLLTGMTLGFGIAAAVSVLLQKGVL